MRNKFAIVFSATALALLAGIAILVVVQPDQVEQRRYYVDVHTGRQRVIRKILFVRTRDSVEETKFSKLWLSFYGGYPAPDWEKYAAFSIFTRGRSPSYGYLGIETWQDWLVMALETGTFDTTAKQQIISAFVKHLERRSPQAARDYAADVLTTAYESSQAGKKLTALPQWMVDGSRAPR